MSDYKNDEMYKKIKESTQVSVPDSLRPENIEKMLEARKPKKKNKFKVIYAGIAAAAVLAVGTVTLLHEADLGTKKEDTYNQSQEAYVEKQQEETVASGFVTAKNYSQIHEVLSNYKEEQRVTYGQTVEEGVLVNESASSSFGSTEVDVIYMESAASVQEDSTISGSEENATENDSTDYSKTNIQEEGVEEADITLTDGEYIYELRMDYEAEENVISIIKPDKTTGSLQHISDINLGKNTSDYVYYDCEMYLYKNQLVVVYSAYSVDNQVLAVTYDITERKNPKEVGKIVMEGDYMDSRIVDGYLYVFSSYGNKYRNIEEEYDANSEVDYIPCVQDSILAPDSIYIPKTKKAAPGYVVGVSVDLEKPNQVLDQFAVLVDNNQFYVSQKHIYIIERDYTNDNSSVIHKFSYDDGNMEPVASNSIKGYINNSFSMDEYNGYLRLVTTSADAEGSTLNHLFVLDEALQVTGSIENLAKGERIYSARFMGDTGFFVTYRQVDPLFSVDLSNPANPVILGELKISGFSEYLHPYGENKLLGIGWETTYDANTNRTTRDGAKLSMFDTTDMGNVKEADKLVLEYASNVIAGDNHKAVLINTDKNLFGFAISKMVGNEYHNYYETYRYIEGKGFELVTNTELKRKGYSYITEVRGVYIGEILYICSSEEILSVSLESGEMLDELRF